MARPNKIGLDYYNTDTDRYQDIKIKKVKHAFGPIGIAVYDFILCEIYRVKGCYIVWDSDTVFGVAEYYGLKETLVNEIVNYCGVVGLFDKELLTSGKVLTSYSIQQRYTLICESAKRRELLIPESIKLTQEEIMLTPEETEDNSGGSTQSKVKESKVKESKESGDPQKKTGFDFREALTFYGFSENLIDDWLKVRKTKKATNTETAFKSFIQEVEMRECHLDDLLTLIIEKSWSGFKWEWVDNLKENGIKKGNGKSGNNMAALNDFVDSMYPKSK